MKIVIASNGQKRLKISKNEWATIGKRKGWMKKAQTEFSDLELTQPQDTNLEDYIRTMKPNLSQQQLENHIAIIRQNSQNLSEEQIIQQLKTNPQDFQQEQQEMDQKYIQMSEELETAYNTLGQIISSNIVSGIQSGNANPQEMIQSIDQIISTLNNSKNFISQ